MAKEKEARRPFNLKKEVKLLPGYIILLLWVIFTIALLGWVFGASFSTTPEIFQGKALKFESGLHFENYAKAWNGAGVAGFFGNSLIYSVISIPTKPMHAPTMNPPANLNTFFILIS